MPIYQGTNTALKQAINYYLTFNLENVIYLGKRTNRKVCLPIEAETFVFRACQVD